MGDLPGRVENLCAQHLGRGAVAALLSEAAAAKDNLTRVGWDLPCHKPQNLPRWGISAGMVLRCKAKGAVLDVVVCQSMPTLHGMCTSPAGDVMAKPCPGTSWLLRHPWGQTLASFGTLQGARCLREKSPSAVKAALYFLPVSFRQ